MDGRMDDQHLCVGVACEPKCFDLSHSKWKASYYFFLTCGGKTMSKDIEWIKLKAIGNSV